VTHRLTTNYAKNYCNRKLTVKVILSNVVTCFLGGHSVERISISCHCLLQIDLNTAEYMTAAGHIAIKSNDIF